MPVIATLEYSCYPLHGRYMVEEFVNDHYDSFRRVKPEVLAALVGPAFAEDVAAEHNYIIRASGDGIWTLITRKRSHEVRRAPLVASAVTTFFAAMSVPFGSHSIGDDVETNYVYREERQSA
jgi:hypothetical protein